MSCFESCAFQLWPELAIATRGIQKVLVLLSYYCTTKNRVARLFECTLSPILLKRNYQTRLANLVLQDSEGTSHPCRPQPPQPAGFPFPLPFLRVGGWESCGAGTNLKKLGAASCKHPASCKLPQLNKAISCQIYSLLGGREGKSGKCSCQLRTPAQIAPIESGSLEAYSCSLRPQVVRS